MTNDAPLFAPDSAIRRIGGESALLVGGGRALLMQVAHPLVAAGVAEHSSFTRDPWRRLARTMHAVYGVVYGTTSEAERIGAGVRRAHERVHGVLHESVGRYPAGTPYRADVPELTLWVHGTLLDTAIEAHEHVIGPLSYKDRVALHDDMKVVAEIFGVPDWALPATYQDFRDYVDGMLGSGALAVGSDARAIARAMVDLPLPLPLRPTAAAFAQITTALLPEPLRALYGLRVGRPQRAFWRASASVSRQIVPHTPRALRVIGPPDNGTRKGLALRVLEAMAR
jgi:uncharacterized protein (DUF2236 family)